MDFIISWAQSLGIAGLVLVSFTESVFSPVLPDLLLIPMALSNPEKAIYYAVIATVASVLGGAVGYGIGHKIGPYALRRFMPAKYAKGSRKLFAVYGGWAILIGAISPIPYKFVSLTAGAFRIKLTVFLAISLVGRAKRFLVEGLLIFYYGPKALEILQRYDDYIFVGLLGAVVLICVIVYAVKRLKGLRFPGK